MEDAIALLGRLTFEKCVNSMSALVVRLLEVLLLDLKTGLTEHSSAFDVPVSNGEVQGVQSLVRLHV